METGLKSNKNYFFPIRWKLIVYFLIFMLLIVSIGIYINLGLKMSARLYKGILDEYKYLEILGEKVYAVKYFTENFLADGSYTNLEKYLTANADLQDYLEKITSHLYLTDNEAKYYSYLDLSRCIDNFSNLSEKIVSSKRNGLVETAYNDNNKMVAKADLIAKYLATLINYNAVWGNEWFIRLTKQTNRIEYLAYFLAIVIGLFSIVFCINFSLGITRPLAQMVKNAEKIASGDFQVSEVSAKSEDELGIITQVFNRMSHNIHDLFNEIRQKVILERELKEEKMHNLEIENLLRESEVQLLQSQINPHFLYNTLNAISQVAIIEDATETGILIKAVARLLRYNLRSLDQPVTVIDEINNIKEYIYIMKVRYGEQVDCRINYPDNLREYLIPCMTLQPIIENAFIHGISGLTLRQGQISVDISEEGDRLRIVITDNGVGITPYKLLEITSKDSTKESNKSKRKGSSNGLGLANIRKRMELFYHQNNLLTISSEPGQGTQVILLLPRIEEADRTHVQFNDCG